MYSKVRIVDISLVKSGFVMFLSENEEGPVLPVVIGVSEAHSIILALNGWEAERPLSHDVMVQIMVECGAKLEKVVIDRLEKDVFFARLYMRTQEGMTILDCRPSDAVALALRRKVPIFMAETILESIDEDDESMPVKMIEEHDLEAQLHLAVEEERYEDAACLRDQLRNMSQAVNSEQ